MQGNWQKDVGYWSILQNMSNLSVTDTVYECLEFVELLEVCGVLSLVWRMPIDLALDYLFYSIL